jgi:hypothetical protein
VPRHARNVAPEPTLDLTRQDLAPEPDEAPPVFVDTSGRRARLAKRLGILAGGALTAYLVVIGANLAMGADVPLTPWPAGTGETRSPSVGDKPDTREPRPDPTTPRSRAGGGSGASAGTAGTTAGGAATPTSAPTAVRTTQRGKAPATPPGQARDKPKQNG